MGAQITLTQQSDGTWTASIAEGDETITFVGASATIQPYVPPPAPPAPPPQPAPPPTAAPNVGALQQGDTFTTPDTGK